MRLCHVFAGKIDIVPHHVQGFMPEQFLKGEEIASISNELNGGCPPEAMRVEFLHA